MHLHRRTTYNVQTTVIRYVTICHNVLHFKISSTRFKLGYGQGLSDRNGEALLEQGTSHQEDSTQERNILP